MAAELNWLSDLLGQRLFVDGAEVLPTLKRWNITGADATFNAETGQIDISFGGGLDWQESVRFATTGALPANTRVGNTLTADVFGVIPVQDGVTPAVGDRALIKDEATGANRGLYVIDDLGSVSTFFSMTRAVLADESGEITAGMMVRVEEGTVNSLEGGLFQLDTTGTIVINSTILTFTKYSIGVTGSGTDRAIPTWDATGTGLRDNATATIDASGNMDLTTGTLSALSVDGEAFLAAESSLGALPASGSLRIPNTGTIVWADFSGAVAQVFAFDASDDLAIGTTDVNNITSNIAIGGSHDFQINGISALSLDATFINFNRAFAFFDAALASFNIGVQADPSGAGGLFRIQGQDAFATSGAAGGNVQIITGNGDGAGVDGDFIVTVGGSNRLTLDETSMILLDRLDIGSEPGTSGLINIDQGGTLSTRRAGVGDRDLIGLTASTVITAGDLANATFQIFAATLIDLNIAGSTAEFRVAAAALTQNVPAYIIGAAQTAPSLVQATATAGGGENFTITAQAAFATSGSGGGNIIVGGGAGDGAGDDGNVALHIVPASFQSMGRGLFVGDAASVPTGDPAAGGFLYSEVGAGKWRGSSGTITTFGAAEPHCPKCERDFALEWASEKYGDLSVCVWCLTDALEEAGFDPGIIEKKEAA